MTLWSAFADRIELEPSPRDLTWYGIGGSVRFLARPRDVCDLIAMRRAARHAGLPFRILGRGANVVIRDTGFDGVAAHLNSPAFVSVEFEGGCVRAGAGANLVALCRRCSKAGLSGLEGLAGIPATVGGAVRMNAGGGAGQIGDVVERVEVLTSADRVETVAGGDVGFGYRRWGLGDAVVLSVWLRLTPADAIETYARFRRCWRRKRASQPLGERSAGCVFKNPPAQFAGALIDQAGMKGATCGLARVSPEHANFIVARNGAKASDVIDLVDRVRRRVFDVFGTRLELEMEIW